MTAVGLKDGFAPRTLLLLALLLTAGTPLAGQEQNKEPFTEARFEELQEQGAFILVDIFADWCPTCAEQQAVLSRFREQHPDIPLHTLTVDFDRQKEWVTHFAAPRQSTLILYQGREQLWFSVAETREDVIVENLLAAVPER